MGLKRAPCRGALLDGSSERTGNDPLLRQWVERGKSNTGITGGRPWSGLGDTKGTHRRTFWGLEGYGKSIGHHLPRVQAIAAT